MVSRPTVLIIDDDSDLRNHVRTLLGDRYTVTEAADGIEGIKQAIRETPALILLDILMPRFDGYQTCEALRMEAALVATPIIMLSGLKDSHERVKAFRAGADDFLVKPFEGEELIARMESKLTRFRELGTRPPPVKEGVTVCGNLTLERQSQQITVAGKPVRLGPIDFRLLRFLIENCGRVCTREEILDAVWDSPDRSVRILDTHILALRKKLDGFDHAISAVYGAGYILKPIAA